MAIDYMTHWSLYITGYGIRREKCDQMKVVGSVYNMASIVYEAVTRFDGTNNLFHWIEFKNIFNIILLYILSLKMVQKCIYCGKQSEKNKERLFHKWVRLSLHS